MLRRQEFPVFKYNPRVYENAYFIREKGVCQCCGKTVELYASGMYAEENISCICVECIANGSAAIKFDGTFIQDADPVENKEAIDELFNRTPGYSSWQGERWAACCNDYCEYLGRVGIEEIAELGISDEVFDENGSCDGWKNIKTYLKKDGDVCGHLFRCLHCGRYILRIDAI